jgi:hypothetical protein
VAPGVGSVVSWNAHYEYFARVGVCSADRR